MVSILLMPNLGSLVFCPAVRISRTLTFTPHPRIYPVTRLSRLCAGGSRPARLANFSGCAQSSNPRSTYPALSHISRTLMHIPHARIYPARLCISRTLTSIPPPLLRLCCHCCLYTVKHPALDICCTLAYIPHAYAYPALSHISRTRMHIPHSHVYPASAHLSCYASILSVCRRIETSKARQFFRLHTPLQSSNPPHPEPTPSAASSASPSASAA